MLIEHWLLKVILYCLKRLTMQCVLIGQNYVCRFCCFLLFMPEILKWWVYTVCRSLSLFRQIQNPVSLYSHSAWTSWLSLPFCVACCFGCRIATLSTVGSRFPRSLEPEHLTFQYYQWIKSKKKSFSTPSISGSFCNSYQNQDSKLVACQWGKETKGCTKTKIKKPRM